MGLYRDEAKRAYSEKWIGEAIPDPARGLRPLVAILGLVLLMLVLVISTVQFPIVTMADGTLFMSQERYEIPVQSGYSVKQVFVEQGQEIQAGAEILVLEDPFRSSDSERQEQLMGQLDTVESDVVKFIESSDSRLARERRRYKQEVELIEQEIDLREASIEALEESLEISRQSKMSAMDAERSGLLSVLTVNDSRISYAETRSTLARSRADLAALRREAAVLKQRVHDLESSEAASKLDYGQMLTTLLRSRLEEMRASRQIVASPISGIVAQVSVMQGEWIDSSKVGATVLSSERSVKVRLLVSASSVANVAIGETVPVRVDAFDYKKFGVLDGIVVDIASSVSSAFADGDEAARKEGRYVVTVSVSPRPTNPVLYGKVLDGMRVSVPIESKRDTVIGHLFTG